MAPKAKLVAFHPVHGYKIKPPQDLKTIKRNERERKRVETVNKGFETLRQHVPAAAPVKKMSKVSILNEAMEYIAYLRTVLVNTADNSSSSEPVLLNYTQHIPYQYQSQVPYHQSSATSIPQSPAHNHLYSPYHHQHHQSSDQGFVSDYSQSSPAPAWHSPQPQYSPHPQCTPQHHSSYPHYTQKPQDNKISSSSQYPSTVSKFEKDEDSSGDEDDILDAIAEWQQQ